MTNLPPLSAPAPAAGDVIGPYVLEQQLGRGGMGMVWRARHSGTGRAVALKLIVARYAGVADVADRFRREAQVLGRLQHPYIVDVSDFGADRGRLYLVMELLGGRSLRDALEEKKTLPLVDVVDVVDQVAAALEHAHAQGVVHRDLKPENLQLTPAGERVVVRVLDFGIARLGDDDATETTPLPPDASTEPGLAPSQQATASAALTELGTVLGTPPYMAPEQFFAQRVSGATDVYALAALVWECLTGTAPRPGNANQLLLAHMERRPPVLDDKRVSWSIRGLLRQAMDPDPTKRPTPRVFAGQLRVLAGGGDAVYAAAKDEAADAGLSLRVTMAMLVAIFVSLAVVTAVDLIDEMVFPLSLLAVPWVGGGFATAWRHRLPLRRFVWGPVLASAGQTPPHARAAWVALTLRYVISLVATLEVFVVAAVGSVAVFEVERAVMGDDARSPLPIDLMILVPFSLPFAAAVVLTVRQVRAGELLRRALRGEATLPLRRRRGLPGWARTGAVVVVALAVTFAATRPLLHRALRSGATGLAQLSLWLGASADPGDDFDPLLLAIERHAADAVVASIIARRAIEENAALHLAVDTGAHDAVRLLCRSGRIDVRERDAEGRGALSRAVASPAASRARVVAALVACDAAALDAVDADGVTPRTRLGALADPQIAQSLAQHPG